MGPQARQPWKRTRNSKARREPLALSVRRWGSVSGRFRGGWRCRRAVSRADRSNARNVKGARLRTEEEELGFLGFFSHELRR